jgi:antibiotic biosynthesis monooxygenase (ABM) superfamily enzyme
MFTVRLLPFQYHFVKRVLSCLYHFLIFFASASVVKNPCGEPILYQTPENFDDISQPKNPYQSVLKVYSLFLKVYSLLHKVRVFFLIVRVFLPQNVTTFLNLITLFHYFQIPHIAHLAHFWPLGQPVPPQSPPLADNLGLKMG